MSGIFRAHRGEREGDAVTTVDVNGYGGIEGERRDVRQVVAELTLAEKAALTAGVDMWTTCPVDRLGIPSWRLTDGPHGARGRRWGASATRALALPTGSALGATWDADLLAEVGAELGRETRARSAHVLLGPTVNLQRSPLAGRTFECFSEDPLLSGVLGAAYVTGVQDQGVAATVKHLAGNEAEWQRNSVDSEIDERTLREVYLLPFEHCVRAGAKAVMTAYNRLNGDHCPNLSWLLDDIVRGDWGFDGIVMTDWWGIVDTARAARAGLDLEMPGPARAYGPALADAVRRGELAERNLDDIVTRLLSTFRRLDRGGQSDDGEQSRDGEATRRFARRVASAAMVLVKNDDDLLPMSLEQIDRVAVVGPNAGIAGIMGGGSSQVRAPHRTPPLIALRRAWGERVDIVFEPGCGAGIDPTPLEPWELTNARGEPGFLVEYWADPEMQGDPIAVHAGDDFRIQYLGPPGDDVPYPHFAARAAATFTAMTPGPHEFVLRSNADAHLRVDGEDVVDLAGGADADWFGALRELRWPVELAHGQQLELAVEFVNPPFDTYGRTSLSCLRPVRDDALQRAVDAATDADVAVVIVGTSDLIESEGYDRRTLALPDGQDELVERVVAANPRTVVIVNSGGPVAMPWLDRVPAVVHAWFGGQELGGALADVLDGTAEPSGRMPFTVPHRIEDTPTFGNFPGEAGSVRYGEGLLIGHRWYDTRGIPVAVPFGHGGSYTDFTWTEPTLVALDASSGAVVVELTITNTGGRAGSDVVQVYVSPPTSTPLFRPNRELKAFRKVHLRAGESRRVHIELDWRAFAHWTPEDSAAIHHPQVRTTPFASTVPSRTPPSGWTVHPGVYRIDLARSACDTTMTLEHPVTSTIEGAR
jgi:beta-glucosidase